MPEQKKSKYLLFIDTNIYLDFYRASNDAQLTLLSELVKVKDKIISTYQVEMEFKNNRQRVIENSLKKLEMPQTISFPAFRSRTKTAEKTTELHKELCKRINAFKHLLIKIMSNPLSHDKVYQACQKIFRHGSDLNLNRDKKERYSIRKLARKRFILGYPPRKMNDTSMGDAVNWEWIIQCCIAKKANVVIVSRDGDYGITYKNKSFLNDWLVDEFKRRVSSKRRIILTRKLSEGLKALSVSVSEKAEKAEKESIQDRIRREATEEEYLRALNYIASSGLWSSSSSSSSSSLSSSSSSWSSSGD